MLRTLKKKDEIWKRIFSSIILKAPYGAEDVRWNLFFLRPLQSRKEESTTTDDNWAAAV